MSDLPQLVLERKNQEYTMRQIAKILHTGKTRTTGGGENGTSRSSDGRSTSGFRPPARQGSAPTPEQLFAAAWSACFESAIALAAQQRTFPLPIDVAID